MHGIQVVLVCFAAFGMSRVLIRFRRGGTRLSNLGLWFLFWVLVVIAALRPETTDLLASWMGVGRGVDTAMYLGFLVIFYLVFRAFAKLEDLDRQLTRVVRANALKDAEAQLTPPDSGKPSAP